MVHRQSILVSVLPLSVTKGCSTTMFCIGLRGRNRQLASILYPTCLRFKLARMDNTKSYSVLPVDCIMNGVVMMSETRPQLQTLQPHDTRYWALLSPREHEQYKLLFRSNEYPVHVDHGTMCTIFILNHVLCCKLMQIITFLMPLLLHV
jgi:hypothetical protein